MTKIVENMNNYAGFWGEVWVLHDPSLPCRGNFLIFELKFKFPEKVGVYRRKVRETKILKLFYLSFLSHYLPIVPTVFVNASGETSHDGSWYPKPNS